jgi:outer membrane scaffolding protein for murein synthesis (MipA/OmpV family)
VATFVSGLGFALSGASSRVLCGLLTALVAGAAAAGEAGVRDAPVPPPRTEGAIGLVLRQEPLFPGSTQQRLGVSAAGFVRWRGLSITGDGGFTTRNQEAVEGGLAAVLARGERSRLRLGLAWDGGRKASSSTELAGLDDVPATVRVRLGFAVAMPDRWDLNASLAVDALGRGSGAVGQVGLGHGWTLPQRQSLSLGLSALWGDDDHQRRRFGVSPAAAAASGLPVFKARAGWQSLQAGLIWRVEFDALGEPWSAFVAASRTQLVGGAARSPVSRQSSWSGLSAGLVWRF